MRGTSFRAYSREFCKNLVSFFGFMLESSIFSHLRWSAHHCLLATNALDQFRVITGVRREPCRHATMLWMTRQDDFGGTMHPVRCLGSIQSDLLRHEADEPPTVLGVIQDDAKPAAPHLHSQGRLLEEHPGSQGRVDPRDPLQSRQRACCFFLGSIHRGVFVRGYYRPGGRRRTEDYWRDRHGAVLASDNLLDYVFEHFQKVTALLEGALLPTTRTRLCCIASRIAQLAGHLLFDMGEFAYARKFHQVAISAAQEGNNQALEAAAWGKISYTWTYNGNAPEALRCIREARRLAIGSANTTVRAYLAAVEAEIQAILGDRKSYLKALHVAEEAEDHQYPTEEMYWLRFDRSRLAGYQGTCFRRLYHHDDARTHSFLEDAQRALSDALALLDPARIQRRPALLIDIAGTYAQQEDVEGACEYAIEALSITAQTKSRTVVRRLFTLRSELEPWKDTKAVRNLDEQIALLIPPGGYRGIA